MQELPADPAAHVAATLSWLHPGKDEVFELCLISPLEGSSQKLRPVAQSPHWEGRAFGKKRIVAGWFRDKAKATALVAQVKAEGIYLTLNSCQKSLLGRANERLKANADRSNDKDMAAFRNLLIDLDPQRPAGVSSSDSEHEFAALFAQQLKVNLAAAGWPAPLVGDSGNGAHLIYAVELDNSPENTELLKGVLGALGQRYAAKLAECGLDIDGKNFNAARLSKLYGTQTHKGDHTPERPHRYAKIVELPEVRQPVSLTLLQDLAASFVPQASGRSGANLRHSGEEKQGGRFDLAAYLDHYGVEVVEVKNQGSAKLHVLEHCIFDAAHGRKEASIGQAAGGKLFYQCFHNSCNGRDWAEARELISHGDKLGQFMVGGSMTATKRRRNLRVVGGGSSPASTGGAQASGDTPPPEPAMEGFSFSDLGNARRLAALHGRDLRYNHLAKKWMHFNGKHWQVDDSGEVVRRAMDTINSFYMEALQSQDLDTKKGLLKHALRSEQAPRVAGMNTLAQSLPGISVLPHELDSNPYLFNCDNGTIDLRTGELRGHHREDLLTCLAPVTYDPEAECPTFEKFLYEIMGNNIDLYDFLWHSFGYALTGDCREQCFWIFWGNGANGKGTLMNLLLEVQGNYGMQIATESLLARQNPAEVRNDIAQLNGPRFVTGSEIDKGRRLGESLVKSLTGQDPIRARFLYGENFQFIPQFKLFIATNNKPIIRDQTNAIWRRIKLVEFPMDFKDNPDRELADKLRAEKSGILAWMVRGCLNWQQLGHLAEPDEVKDAVQEYKAEMNQLKDFLDDKCMLGAEITTPSADLYKAYKEWAEENGLTPKEKLAARSFGLALGEQGFRKARTGRVRSWRGLGLRTLD